jgi:cohesin complex subunit SA-1/2
VSAFLQAVYTGAIGIRHSAVLLAHYGRLGETFDLCLKTLIDVLRDEGMFQDNGTLVADVIIQAICDVCRFSFRR